VSKTKQDWFVEIDYLRAIAIIAVLVIHTTDDTAAVKKLTELTFSLMYIEELVRFAVPMFVIISGFVLYNKYRSELPMKEFYKKRFIVILIPYIIFSIIYYIMNAYLGLLPTITLDSIISSIFNFNAAGHFWYIQLILTFYVFYPAIIAYYEIIKSKFRIYTLTILFLSVLIMYFLGSFIPSFGFALGMPFKYLIYFLFGIYINDNYEQIRRDLEKTSMKKIIPLVILIVSFPLFSMFLTVDSRCSTQFSNSIPYYYQLTLISTHILHMCIFLFCLYLILLYKPRIRILQKIGEYSYGIFLIHAIFHNLFTVDIFPKFSILPSSLTYYIILFTVMLTMSYYTVKLMLTNHLTTFVISGKLNGSVAKIRNAEVKI
jgi:probable poly-beta-1,6-N-acetyl-D-glucosamine export protein